MNKDVEELVLTERGDAEAALQEQALFKKEDKGGMDVSRKELINHTSMSQKERRQPRISSVTCSRH